MIAQLSLAGLRRTGPLLVLGIASLVADSVRAAPERIGVAISARAIQPGELLLISITPPFHADSIRVAAFGRSLVAFKANDGSWRALAGIDVAQRPGRYTLKIEVHGGAATTIAERQIFVRRKDF